MIGVLVALAANVGGVSAPTDDATVLSRFLAGDLVTLRRAAVLRRAAGERVDIGRLALLDDLSRLVRCLPLGPIPADETSAFRPARALVRLERVRLERLMRDRAHRGTTLAALLGRKLYQLQGAADPRVVRWPIEDEVWPGETQDPTLAPAGCPSRAGSLAERPAKNHRERRRIRLRAERGRIASMLGSLEAMPPVTASKIALLYLSDAEAVHGFVVEKRWRDALTRSVAVGPNGLRTASRLLLGRLAERADAKEEAMSHYRAVLGDPSRTAEEDSRTRVRLAALLEPDWPSVLDVVRGTKRPRGVDELVLINAEARALYALGENDALMSLGRKLVVRPGLSGKFFDQTIALLTMLALDLEPPQAIAWLNEIAPADRDRRAARYEELAELARERSKFDLAVAIYDHRRLELLDNPRKRSPRVAAEDVRLIARRAFIEYDREDVEAFGGFIDELIRHADEQEGRPLARFAPHKELARLTQDLLGRLTDDVPGDPERQKYAALLLEANAALTKRPSRHRRILERHQPHLIRLAGEYAEGRKPQVRTNRKKKPKPVKQLGEVVVARLPPQLEAPDVGTNVPVIRSLLVYEERPGVWSEGAPWARLVPDKKRR